MVKQPQQCFKIGTNFTYRLINNFIEKSPASDAGKKVVPVFAQNRYKETHGNCKSGMASTAGEIGTLPLPNISQHHH